MKLIFANKYYYLRGGAERYLFDLQRLLESKGHEVIPFAMRDWRDKPSRWWRYFVSPVTTEKVSISLAGLKTAGRSLFSFEAERKFSTLLDKVKPDLVHVHNIYRQISPSILPPAKKRGLPVVMTIHDYNLIAPNYTLFHDGQICEITKPKNYWAAVGHRCVKNSRTASALAAAELSLHRRLGLYEKNVDAYIAPSRFVRAILGEYGVGGDRIRVLPHFIDASAWEPRYEGDYALYVGRLSPEKGVDVLIRAAAAAKYVPLRIVGTGPEEDRLKRLVASLNAKNIEFRGFREGAELLAEYAGARFVVIPSVWYEVFGLTALEAYAAGKPVVASEIGGLAELIRPGETGVPVSAGDVGGLAEVLAGLFMDTAACERLGRAGRAWVEKDFTPDEHYRRLMAIYKEVS